MWHTRTDGTVSFKNSVDYAMQLQKYGVPFELHVFCNGPHGLSLATKETTCNDEKVGVCVSVWVQLAANWLSQTQGFEIKYKQNKGQ
ncbi:acetyl esterase [Corallococcus sp. CAG:1435]|nr:acetyl esterase [Corallococcus sp. CAG:1435]